MTKEEIIEMAKESNLLGLIDCAHYTDQAWIREATAFAKLIAEKAIKEALAQTQEPVAWGVFDDNLHDMFFGWDEAQEMVRLKGDGSTVKPLYTHTPTVQLEKEPIEYWNAVEGWVKIDEVREHFGSVGCGTIYKTAGEDRTPLYTAPPQIEVGCAECGVGNHHALYCVACAEKFVGLENENRSILIRTLKWCEDLLREAGHDEAVSDVQDCIMLLRKAQKK